MIPTEQNTQAKKWEYAEEFPAYNDERNNILSLIESEEASAEPLYAKLGKSVWQESTGKTDGVSSSSVKAELQAVFSRIEELKTRLLAVEFKAEMEHKNAFEQLLTEEPAAPSEEPEQLTAAPEEVTVVVASPTAEGPTVAPPAEDKIICPRCKNPCEKHAKFCKNCGLKLEAPGSAPGDCPKCGHRNGPGVNFCRECGTRIDAPKTAPGDCPKCGCKNAPGTKFCRNCGTQIGQVTEKICPRCGFKNNLANKFCKSCGNKFD